jgi:hypothetical protein
MDQDLQALGINLDAEFAEIYQEIPVTAAHQGTWHETTQKLFALCQDMELGPQPTPKMGLYERCVHCGRCILGCPHDVKWDSRQFIEQALQKGAQLITGCKADRVVVKNGRVSGVEATRGWTRAFYPADVVVLAAGGLATPLILQHSGLACAPTLFVDPVLCVAAPWTDCRRYREVAMPFIVQREGFIVSPYFDYLSFCFNRAWTYPGKDILSLMIKVADSNSGATSQGTVADGKVDKRLTAADRQRLSAGVSLCREILRRFGADTDSLFLGTVNAGHPGGMLPLTEREANSFHHSTLPENLYVADATLFPRSLGNPPILTIIAMAKRVAKICAHAYGLAAPATPAPSLSSNPRIAGHQDYGGRGQRVTAG